VQADIVISSTSAPHYVLGKFEVSRAMARRPDRPMLLIDLAVPRDIDPATLDVNSVYLYNIDQLSELARMNMERRQTEAVACEQLVAQHAESAASALLGCPARPGTLLPKKPAVEQPDPALPLQPVGLLYA
jgi:glutamyl-tRNA reductase